MRFDSAFGIPLSRLEVDFHIPDLAQDARLAIDPFLMYKSRHPRLLHWHDKLMLYFAHVVALIESGQLDEAVVALCCPEPNEIRLGYTADGAAGAGIGPETASDLVEVIRRNPPLLARGLRHLEELQLFAVGIGADRLSDLVANVLKMDLLQYTNEQAALWGFPIAKDVGLRNAWDFAENEWADLMAPMPTDPETGQPVIVVPRRVLRRLPWINYDDFRDHYLLSFLAGTKRADTRSKRKVIELTQHDLGLVDRYIDAKESSGSEAAPFDLDDRDRGQIDKEAEEFESELESIPTGKEAAGQYEDLCLRILNSAFEPELIDGRKQQRTAGGTQIRDLIFINDSDHSFWTYVRTEHKALLLTFEIKNKRVLAPADLNQIHSYLGDSAGFLGFVVSRNGFKSSDSERARTLYNRRTPHSVILDLSDRDLIELLRWKKTAQGPTMRVREIYRDFMTSL